MGARDSMVADLLQQEQLEASGRSQRKLASRSLLFTFIRFSHFNDYTDVSQIRYDASGYIFIAKFDML